LAIGKQRRIFSAVDEHLRRAPIERVRRHAPINILSFSMVGGILPREVGNLLKVVARDGEPGDTGAEVRRDGAHGGLGGRVEFDRFNGGFDGGSRALLWNA
jgi:hypothetical protein